VNGTKHYPALELLRALKAASTQKTWDPTVGLFWDADDLARDLSPADVADEATCVVRRALADCLSLEVPALVEWERARVRVWKEVSTLLRRAEDRLTHGHYFRDENLELAYVMDDVEL
jgi:hypothetical protein